MAEIYKYEQLIKLYEIHKKIQEMNIICSYMINQLYEEGYSINEGEKDEL